MGKSSPPPPDYAGAAREQGEQSMQNTTAQTWANRPNVYTPFGNQTWQSGSTVDPATGQRVTNWSSNINLTPDQQAALDDQMAIQSGRSQLALESMPRVRGELSESMDYSGMPQRSGSVLSRTLDTTPGQGMQRTAGDWRQQAQDAAWNYAKPQLEENRSRTETQLANQGITRGSDAYETEMRRLGDEEQRARWGSYDAGRAESEMLFSQDLQSSDYNLREDLAGNSAQMQQQQQDINAGEFNNTNRSQAIAEEAMRRGMTLNEMNALLSGQQVSTPQMPSFANSGRADTPDLMGAMLNGYEANVNGSNAKNAQTASTMGAIASALAYFFS